MVDEKQSPWFIPVNWFMSKISEEDWYLTPANTNLNESAHPYTNKHTGTNLKILEAIQKYGKSYSRVVKLFNTFLEPMSLISTSRLSESKRRKTAFFQTIITPNPNVTTQIESTEMPAHRS